MSSTVENEFDLGEGGLLHRSTFVKMLSRAGMMAVAGVGTFLAKQPTVALADGNCHPSSPECCCLKHQVGSCPGTGQTHSCPSGTVKKYWACCRPGMVRVRFCSECVQPNAVDCFDGPWKCSETWVSSVGC